MRIAVVRRRKCGIQITFDVPLKIRCLLTSMTKLLLNDDVVKPDESEMVELFLREAVIMKDFRHHNVLRIIGVTFDGDGSPMVILPFMANGDLRQYILNPKLVCNSLDSRRSRNNTKLSHLLT
jgi:serine/threonine protein kinase